MRSKIMRTLLPALLLTLAAGAAGTATAAGTPTAAGTAIAAGFAAQADRGRDAAERATDRQDLLRDRRQLADDLRDLAVLQSLIERHAAAARRGDQAALKQIGRQVNAMLGAEIGESNREVGQAAREVRQGRREVRSDRREIREVRREHAGPVVRLDERHDRLDDRRDLRDDRLDLQRAAARRARLIRIRDEWRATGRLGGPRQVERQGELLHELLGLARAEIGSDRGEAREDHRELREDRRQTREDLRRR